ncbi:MAG: DeoR/GlpR family DNA-binding transcription regulator [Lachnospiraceae bacterium]|nr:DeoR/GlpR family DNA-binding transcription regulator [Lachnospiraceae bacterium]
MLAAERRNIILAKIQEEKKVVVSELSRIYEVSEETIRRDLDRLEDEGYIVKSYGGAVLNESNVTELPHNVRRGVNISAKQKIAELACGEIEENDHIFLDASTTSVFIAKWIKQKEHLTVITNSIENLLELSTVTGWDIISTGGQLRSGTMSLTGWKTAEALSAYHVDKVFMSCKGLSMERGITDGNDETAGIKQAMIASADKVYLAADLSKFGKKAFSQICGFDRIDTVITDAEPDTVWKDYFTANRIGLVYPKA